MHKAVFNSRAYYSFMCAVLFFGAAAASFNGYYDKFHFREAGVNDGRVSGAIAPVSGFTSLVNGDGIRPVVYRQLLPMTANWLDSQVPLNVREMLYTMKGRGDAPFRERFFVSPVAQSHAYFLKYFILYVMVFLFAWLAVYAMYELAIALGNPPAAASLAAIGMILLMPYLIAHLYDYPELAFFALSVWMALKGKWWWLIPVAALATWNKESYLFFILTLYPIFRSRGSRVNALVGTGVLGLTSAIVYGVLALRFHNNPGGSVEYHLMDHINFMTHPGNLFLTQKTYGLELLMPLNPLSIALILWTLWRGWHYLPKPIQCHAKIAAIINFPLYFLFGYPGELRGLSMLYVTLLLLLAANLTAWTGDQTRTLTQHQRLA